MVTEKSAPPPDDLSCPVKGLYRLFDLITEPQSSNTGNILPYRFTSHSSRPLADRIVIAQESLQAFINALSPGACLSITKINFKILDDLLLKPIGIYGSREEIVRFLREMGTIDPKKMCVYRLLYCRMLTSNTPVLELLTPLRAYTSRGAEVILRSGLYLIRSSTSTTEVQTYVVYWPEDTTWNDNAISSVRRNRVTFMRYSRISVGSIRL